MALMTLEEYLSRRYTPTSIPPKHRVWRWLREGKIPFAIKEGRRYMIDEKALELTGNKLVDRVL